MGSGTGYVSGRGQRPQRLDRGIGVKAHGSVPTRLDRLGPFSHLAQRDARNAIEVRLFLKPTRVGEERTGALKQSGHVQVSHRRNRHDPVSLEHRPRGTPTKPRRSSGMNRKDDRRFLTRRHKDLHQLLEP